MLKNINIKKFFNLTLLLLMVTAFSFPAVQSQAKQKSKKKATPVVAGVAYNTVKKAKKTADKDASPVRASMLGDEVASYAVKFEGNRYVAGGSSLTHGTDCSGFTMSVYKKFGISLPHSSRAQAGYGKSVSVSEMIPGDLVFYGGRGIHHVALYIGDGKVVHATTQRTGIMVTRLTYSGSPVKARRVA
ncbi:MAG: C40 family peptidase [Lachnospiraceae bacterium]|jgi:cell wall-associated NlpC family hydrolase|nr:C40 family peptidase [Lachnospiraceae bacterium]MEE3461019.1 C40 family peptidase [Lachnospiraceae bacterium]